MSFGNLVDITDLSIVDPSGVHDPTDFGNYREYSSLWPLVEPVSATRAISGHMQSGLWTDDPPDVYRADSGMVLNLIDVSGSSPVVLDQHTHTFPKTMQGSWIYGYENSIGSIKMDDGDIVFGWIMSPYGDSSYGDFVPEYGYGTGYCLVLTRVGMSGDSLAVRYTRLLGWPADDGGESTTFNGILTGTNEITCIQDQGIFKINATTGLFTGDYIAATNDYYQVVHSGNNFCAIQTRSGNFYYKGTFNPLTLDQANGYALPLEFDTQYTLDNFRRPNGNIIIHSEGAVVNLPDGVDMWPVDFVEFGLDGSSNIVEVRRFKSSGLGFHQYVNQTITYFYLWGARHGFIDYSLSGPDNAIWNSSFDQACPFVELPDNEISFIGMIYSHKPQYGTPTTHDGIVLMHKLRNTGTKHWSNPQKREMLPLTAPYGRMLYQEQDDGWTADEGHMRSIWINDKYLTISTCGWSEYDMTEGAYKAFAFYVIPDSPDLPATT